MLQSSAAAGRTFRNNGWTMIGRLGIVFGIPLLVWCAVSYGQLPVFTPVDEGDQTLIITADSTRTVSLDNEYVKSYFGNVRATRQDIVFTAQEASYNSARKIARFLGGVTADQHDVHLKADEALYETGTGDIRFVGGSVLRDSVRTVTADTLLYNHRDRVAVASGNVIVQETGRLFRADMIRYEKDLRLLMAEGHIYVSDDSLMSTITGMTALFNDSTRYGIIAGKPELTRRDGESLMEMTGEDTLEVDRPGGLIRVWNDVVMTRDSLTVKARMAVYIDSTETVLLTGSPEAEITMWNDPTDETPGLQRIGVVTGDTIQIGMADQQITGVYVAGGAVSTITAHDSTGSLYDRSVIESATMHMEMTDGLVSLVTAEGTAQSYYHRAQMDDVRMFINEAEGDTIIFYFDEGHADHMRITGKGGSGARGSYHELSPLTKNVDADEDSLNTEGKQVNEIMPPNE